jgi:hypothetical protein
MSELWIEPHIEINSVTLTVGQAMTLRVALSSFVMTLTHEGLGDDEHGKAMTAAYLQRAKEIESIMLRMPDARIGEGG